MTRLSPLACLCLLLGCGDDVGGAPIDGATSGIGSATGIDPDEGADDTEDPVATTTDDPFDGAVPAAGIYIKDVSVNQGVEIHLVRDREFVPEPDRNAPVIGRRPALIRGFWELDADFEPREIEARLVVNYADGTVRAFTDTRMIDRESNPNTFPGGFFWDVQGEDFTGDFSYHIELIEVDDVDRGPAPQARLPEQGQEAMKGVTRRMLLDLVIVPTCGRPALAPWEQDIFTAYLYNTYPINELQLTFHEPVSGGCDEVEAAYTTMPNLRLAEGAPPWRYYGGLVLGGCGGIAQYGAGGWAEAMDAPRVFGLCDWRGNFPTVGLFAHELGHVHGRDHTFGAFDWPYDPCGVRPEVGFGLMPGQMPSDSWGSASVEMQQLIPPSDAGCTTSSWNDFMSYAYPYWVSDHTYLGMAEIVWLTSGWADDQGANAPLPGLTLRGAVREDGTVAWGATRGASTIADDLTSTHQTARFFDGDEVVAEHPVQVSWAHRDPGPDEVKEPRPVEVLTVQLPEGVPGDRFEVEVHGTVHSWSTAAWRDAVVAP
ncbi:MAG: hypothetical protein AAF799_25705 [Myxococcota bacterium]